MQESNRRTSAKQSWSAFFSKAVALSPKSGISPSDPSIERMAAHMARREEQLPQRRIPQNRPRAFLKPVRQSATREVARTSPAISAAPAGLADSPGDPDDDPDSESDLTNLSGSLAGESSSTFQQSQNLPQQQQFSSSRKPYPIPRSPSEAQSRPPEPDQEECETCGEPLDADDLERYEDCEDEEAKYCEDCTPNCEYCNEPLEDGESYSIGPFSELCAMCYERVLEEEE